jgi:sterol 3beta-glucosyltransferase
VKITLLSYGTRGDTQPFVALAAALLAQGAEVRLAAPVNHETFVTRCGIPYAPLAGDIQAILASEQGRRWLSTGNVAAFLKAMTDLGHTMRHDLMRDVHAACEGSDAVISQVIIQDLALIAAEKRRLPLMYTHLFPLCATTAFPSPLVTTATLPLPIMNRWTHDLFNAVWWQVSRRFVNELRQDSGLDPIHVTANIRGRQLKTPILQVFSPNVLPRPADWGDEHIVTGFWQLPDAIKAKLGELEPPPGLAEWLAAGPPPVYVGLGSMPVLDPPAMLRIVADVAAELGVRVVVGAGWGIPAEAAVGQPAHVIVVPAVNHDWLFPQCSAIVHHGGVGTTAASLRAGIPTLICAVFGDQPFWGKRVTDLGVGAWMPFAELSRRTLSHGLRRLQDPAMAMRAAALGIALREEDGLRAAVDAVSRFLITAPVP